MTMNQPTKPKDHEKNHCLNFGFNQKNSTTKYSTTICPSLNRKAKFKCGRYVCRQNDWAASKYKKIKAQVQIKRQIQNRVSGTMGNSPLPPHREAPIRFWAGAVQPLYIGCCVPESHWNLQKVDVIDVLTLAVFDMSDSCD